MDVLKDLTYQYNDNWLQGHWTLQDDPPRVLNVFKCLNVKHTEYFDKYLIVISSKPWSIKKYQPVFEEFKELDVLTAQCVVYDILERYKNAPVRNGV